jgi:hypothetical protein
VSLVRKPERKKVEQPIPNTVNPAKVVDATEEGTEEELGGGKFKNLNRGDL